MYDAARVCRLEAVGDLDCPVEQGVDGNGLAAGFVLQRGPIEEFHGEKRVSVVVADLVNRANVRMIDGRR